MNFEIVSLTENKYQEWDNFCLESNDAWFFHKSDTLEYTLNYRPALKTKNLSFFVCRQNKILAIVPLTLEAHQWNGKEIFEFSFGGDAIPSPALANNITKTEKDRSEKDLIFEFIFSEIDRLAAENKVKRVRLRLSPLSLNRLNNIQFNYLVKFGFFDISLNTQLIDLSKSGEELRNDLRRNHRRSIQKGNQFEIKFYTSDNITEDIFYDYKQMHHKAAGRKTRPDKTFELMLDQLKKDLGFLVQVSLNQKSIGFEFYTKYKNQAEGFSAANDPDFEYLPIRHRLEWEAMLWMKKHGIRFYDIGIQQYGSLPHDFPDDKQIHISHFKRGFGGQAVPLLTGEKYYDKEYFLEISRARSEKIADYINKKNSDDKQK
jgi:hypothetical protein